MDKKELEEYERLKETIDKMLAGGILLFPKGREDEGDASDSRKQTTPLTGY